MNASVLYEEILARVRGLRDEVAEPILAGGMTHETYCGAAGRLRGILNCEALIVQTWLDMIEERKIEPPDGAGGGGVPRETVSGSGAEVESQLY